MNGVSKVLFTKIDFPGRVTVCEINNFLDVLIKLVLKKIVNTKSI